jgi:hypothetical protein
VNRSYLIVLILFAALLGGVGYGQERKPETASEPDLVVLPKRGEPILYGEAAFAMAYWKDQSKSEFPYFVPVPEKKGWYLDWDCERQEIKYLVVHHTATANPTGTPEERRLFLTYLSELERERLYKPAFEQKDPAPRDPYRLGLPIHSSHVLDGEGETHEPYHELIFENGDLVTRLIPYRKVGEKYLVEMIGWQAGNWPINCSSIAVALVGNYESNPPPAVVLEKLDKVVAYYRKLVPTIEIRSHKEVKLDPKGTACPGSWFEEWASKYKKK